MDGLAVGSSDFEGSKAKGTDVGSPDPGGYRRTQVSPETGVFLCPQATSEEERLFERQLQLSQVPGVRRDVAAHLGRLARRGREGSGRLYCPRGEGLIRLKRVVINPGRYRGLHPWCQVE